MEDGRLGNVEDEAVATSDGITKKTKKSCNALLLIGTHISSRTFNSYINYFFLTLYPFPYCKTLSFSVLSSILLSFPAVHIHFYSSKITVFFLPFSAFP